MKLARYEIVILAAGAAAMVLALSLFPRWVAGRVPEVTPQEVVVPAPRTFAEIPVFLVHWTAEASRQHHIAQEEYALRRLTVEEEARKSVAQVVFGSFVFLTLLATLRRMRAAESSVEVARAGLRAQKLGEAITALDSESVLVRTSAVHSMQAILHETRALDGADRERATVLHALASHVRVSSTRISRLSDRILELEKIVKARRIIEEALEASELAKIAPRLKEACDFPNDPARQPIGQDIQAALDVLGSENRDDEDEFVIDLSGARLIGADLSHPRTFRRTRFSGCDLTRADFTGTRLGGADFREVEQLLQTRFAGADLEGARFDAVDLRTVVGLTPAQVRGAVTDDATLAHPRVGNP
ncbi:MAG: pentapeptide repeat-containing protein [Planctomycetota bacterium]